MCGITGIFDTRGRRDIDRRVLSRMNESQHHRGPDEGGLHLEPGVGLGHRRLSIIDLSTGQQPLFNEDGSVVVVFNGEIYNYQQLIPNCRRWATSFTPAAIPKSSFTPGKPGARTASSAFAACSPSRCGIATAKRCFSRATGLAVKPLFYALVARWTVSLRFRTQVAAGAWRTGARHRPPGGRGVLRSWLCRRAAHDLSSGEEAATRTCSESVAGGAGRAESLLGCALQPRSASRSRGSLYATQRQATRVDSPAHDFRGAAWRLPVRRGRFERRGGAYGRPIG
jgi:hypothetical protein